MNFIKKTITLITKNIYNNNSILSIVNRIWAAIFLIAIIFRLRIFYLMKVDSAFNISPHPAMLMTLGLLSDILFATMASLLYYGILKLIEKKWNPINPLTQYIFPVAIIVGIALLYIVNHGFWTSMNVGLTRDMILEATDTTKFYDMIKMLNTGDIITLISSLSIIFLYQINSMISKIFNRTCLLFFLMLIIILPIQRISANSSIKTPLYHSPFVYTALSFFDKKTYTENSRHALKLNKETSQLKSVDLIDKRLTKRIRIQKDLPNKKGKNYNILYIVLESTGYEYIFNTSRGNPIPMPFLKELSERSLFMENHISTGNTSPRSLFSMMSGLYPSPRVKMFCTRKNVFIPSIISFMDKSYDSFLVTPGSTDWFFTKGFLKNSGIKNIYGYKELPGQVKYKKYGKSDLDGVNFFLKRLDAKKDKNFVAVYYSYAAHWPYVDYGKKFRIFKNTRNRLLRYYNNLRMLDTRIKKIYQHLEDKGILDNTIIIIVGDHGEAFNQHKGNWVHSRSSFNENIKVPFLIYNESLFEAKREKRYTSHIDIVPTILDALRIPYNPALMQGESLFQKEFKRKYLFLFGNENTMTSFNTRGLKLQHSFKKEKCWAYDLAVDPFERKKLDCSPFSEQKKTMMFYYSYQPLLLKSYNKTSQQKTDFHGQRHPQ